MASSADSIALALEGRATMVTASAVRTYRPTPVSRAASARMAAARRPHQGSPLETAPRRIVSALTSADASHCRSLALPGGDGSRGWRRAVWRAEGACQERARARCRSGASLRRAALEQGAASGAQVGTGMGHARPDTIDVRDVLLAEPHRIRFA